MPKETKIKKTRKETKIKKTRKRVKIIYPSEEELKEMNMNLDQWKKKRKNKMDVARRQAPELKESSRSRTNQSEG